MAEVSDDDLTVLQRGFRLLQTLNGHPDARPLLEKALKAVDPKIQTTEEQAHAVMAPALVEVTRLTEELKAERDARTQAEKARVEAEEQANYEGAFRRMRDGAEGLTAEGEEEVRKIMVERKIADPEAAFLVFQKNNPKIDTSRPSYLPDTWNFQDDAVENDIGLLWERPDRWADQMIPKILADERREPVRV